MQARSYFELRNNYKKYNSGKEGCNLKKSGLREMKKQNRRVVIQTILERGALSRIEIANLTELSPSTVSGLVSELLEEGLLVENGVHISTGGRSRTELTINKDRGAIAVVEIGRKGSRLILFDLSLQMRHSVSLSENYLCGNDLLVALTQALFQCVGHDAIRNGVLMGIGLLFQKDMRPSDFNVVYSTGFASASISLVEALITQFRVPVVEEYSQNYTAAQAMQNLKEEKVNSAHIAIGAAVVASVTIEGHQVPLKNGVVADMTPLLPAEALPLLQQDTAETGGELVRTGSKLQLFAQQIGSLAAVLCTLFNLDVVFLSGQVTQVQGFLGAVERRAQESVKSDRLPRFELLHREDQDNMAQLLAANVRTNVLCAN